MSTTETTVATRTKTGFVFRDRRNGNFLCCRSYSGFAGWEQTSQLCRAAVLKELPTLAGHADYEAIPAIEEKHVTMTEELD